MVVGEIENQSTSRRLMGSLSASSQKGQDKEGKVMGGSGPTGKDPGGPKVEGQGDVEAERSGGDAAA